MNNYRQYIDFNRNWKFKKLPQMNGLSELAIEKIDFEDSDWEEISLPHTWNSIDGADGRLGVEEGGEHYYRGLGGYRKNYRFDKDIDHNKRIFIEFEGANTITELFVNNNRVGCHEGGFAAFRFDITDFIQWKDNNLFTVKVNNAPTDYIAPIGGQGDFTKMGGIYRDVKLIVVEPVHIDLLDYGSSGIYITPCNLKENSADIDLLVKLANQTEVEQKIEVKIRILNSEGNEVTLATKHSSLLSNTTSDISLSTIIKEPIRWNGLQNPYLYTAEIALVKNGVMLDKLCETFGIREYRIDPQEGFFLNNQYLNLHGVNLHQESFEAGWAMTKVQRERDYDYIVELGCNTVRMAHYQHNQYEYSLCDRLGLTVWTEIGIVNKMSLQDDLRIADRFAENAKHQLRELIRQNYNHPSVIIWCISNELYQMSDEIYQFYLELNELAKKEDVSRLISFADSQFWGKFLELPGDVVGYNRYFGWYQDAGAADKLGEWLDLYHNEKEVRAIALSEYGGGAAISQHKDNIQWPEEIDPWGKRHYEEYQASMHEVLWAQLSERNYIWGKYVWCMFDFASDGREEGDTKGLNDKGLMTRERIPKDAFYFYQSVWNKKPMVHLTEQRFKERPYRIPFVKAYSNAESVELFVNGISQGVRYKRELDNHYQTVFTWEGIELTINEENDIEVAATFSDNFVGKDGAIWTGRVI